MKTPEWCARAVVNDARECCSVLFCVHTILVVATVIVSSFDHTCLSQ